MGPLAAAAAPAIIGGIASLWGGNRANRQAREEAATNRGFQERMRNTSWQAAVTDMERAGINPAVAYSRGGAAAPGGNMAAQRDAVTPAVQSAMAANMQRKQLGLMDEQVRETEARTATARALSQKTRYEAQQQQILQERQQASHDYYFTPTGSPRPALQELLTAEHGARMATNAKSGTDFKLATLSLPERRAIAKLYETVGAGGAGVKEFTPTLLSLLGGAAGVRLGAGALSKGAARGVSAITSRSSTIPRRVRIGRK